MNDPLAFFLTWSTYGSWLPGDARGWTEYHHGWQMPAPALELECHARMTEDSVRLNPLERKTVEIQVAETCQHRGWTLHAVNCRSNHIHVVVTAFNTKPKKVRIDLKAYATRSLRSNYDSDRENWWAERGSIRHIHNESTLEAAIMYTLVAQDRKDRDTNTQ